MFTITKKGANFVATYTGNPLGPRGEGPTEAEALYQLGAARARLKSAHAGTEGADLKTKRKRR